jgi:hypothetical protein
MDKILALVVIVVFSGCGIFSPREDFELPDSNAGSQLLSFGGILDSVGEKFEKTGYEDIFADSLIYQDMNSGGFTKKELVSHLQQVQIEYKNMVVKWMPKRENSIKINETLILYKVEYLVILNTSADSITGRSDFTLAKNNQWQIVKWVDYPSSSEKSIFSPQR